MPRKLIKAEYLTSRVEPAIKAQIEALAHKERRTISQTVALLIEQPLQARQSKEQAA